MRYALNQGCAKIFEIDREFNSSTTSNTKRVEILIFSSIKKFLKLDDAKKFHFLFCFYEKSLQIAKLIFKIYKISYLYEHSWLYKINSRLDLPTESTSCFIYCAAQMISTEISFYIELALFDCYYKASSSNLKDIFPKCPETNQTKRGKIRHRRALFAKLGSKSF
mgnify:CR=1 FL=1